MEVCPLSREAKFEPLYAPLQDALRVLHTPLPACLSVSLTGHFPSCMPQARTQTGLPRSVHVPLERRRCCLFADGSPSASRELAALELDRSPFWLRLLSLFSLVLVTTFISSSHLFTISFHPGSPPPRGWQSLISSRDSISSATTAEGLRCPGRFTPRCYQRRTAGRILLAEQQVNSTT